jgi:hypothetical protein
MNYNFNVVEGKNINWEKIHSCYDHTVFKSKEWIDFLIESQNIKPLIVEIFDENKQLGYFVGERFKKIFKIVASPFEGWTTDYQGLSMLVPISKEVRINIYENLIQFLFQKGICSLFQASDWQFDMDTIQNSKLKFEVVKGYKLDLTKTEEQIYKNFSNSSCQYAIRKSQKNGVKIIETDNTDEFIDNYYAQLSEVFKKQNLRPTYKKDRIIALIENLKHSGRILLLEAKSPDKNCLATGIFVGDNNLAYYWGGASYTKFQNLCPNEPLIYEAIKIFKKRGYREFDLGGIRKFKEKFGPDYFEKPKIIASKFNGIIKLKNLAKKTYYGLREIGTKIKSN